MKCEKNKNRFLLNKLLIFLGITCIVFAALIIGLCLDKAEISIFAQNSDYIKASYASTEDTSSTNTWDISENGDGSVIATLDENGLLTISGTGKMGNNDFIPDSIPADSPINKIKSIKIENGISNIGDFIFAGFINLINVEIPSSVTSIGINPFVDCINLININVDSNNAKYKDENGVLYSKDGTKIIVYPAGKTKAEYTILNGTTTICEGAFAGCENLTSVKIPNGVTSIGYVAFEECLSLESIEIPNSVTSIGEDSFYGCKIVNLLNSLNKIIELPNLLKRAANEADILYSSEEFTFTNCTIQEQK